MVHRVVPTSEVLLCDEVLKNLKLFSFQILKEFHLVQACLHLAGHLLFDFVSERKLSFLFLS